MTAYHLTADGCFKPYVRMTQKGKWVDRQAQEYLNSKEWMGHQFAVLMVGQPVLARGTRIHADIYIYHCHGFNHRDLDNEIKAVLDAAQGIVFQDDRWIDVIHAERHRGESGCRVLLFVKTPS